MSTSIPAAAARPGTDNADRSMATIVGATLVQQLDGALEQIFPASGAGAPKFVPVAK